MPKVLFCASEVTPFAKTGGLADVTGALPMALAKLGVECIVVMPRYRGLPAGKGKLGSNVEVYFIENEEFFNRSSLYGNDSGDFSDNLKRFSFFCREVFNLAQKIDFKPDIIHAHDWQTALVPVLLKTEFASQGFFEKAKSLLTIHNAAYQGVFPQRAFEEEGFPKELYSVDGFEFYGRANVLKAGILYADGLNTVSPTYAEEIKTKEYGFGLEGVLKKREDVLKGILNGIDTDLWDPESDKRIKENFSALDMDGKAACKADLQKRYGLTKDPEVPLFGMVTRLAEQKGLDILSEAADAFLSKNVQLVLLGEGDAVYHTTFQNIGKRHPKNSVVHLKFDAVEAHKIYSASDFFLMPSYFEPCGLGQMISMRYGTVPVVRQTGGLADTVLDLDENPKGNGFVFKKRSPEELLSAIDRAIDLFRDKKRFMAVKKRAMKPDFSWDSSAKAYKKLYKEILG